MPEKAAGAAVVSLLFPCVESWILLVQKASFFCPSAGLSGETASKIKPSETSLLFVSQKDWSRVGWMG